jgi:hypothetical protein
MVLCGWGGDIVVGGRRDGGGGSGGRCESEFDSESDADSLYYAVGLYVFDEHTESYRDRDRLGHSVTQWHGHWHRVSHRHRHWHRVRDTYRK